MLDGITFGGFNLVNIRKIFESTGVPVIVIMRKLPNFERIKKALKRFDDWEKRWANVLERERFTRWTILNQFTCRFMVLKGKMQKI